MLNEPTIEKLHELRLAVMAEAWQQQQKDAKIGALSFDERFTLLVDAEHQARDNRRLTRLLKDAQLRIPQACVEDVATSAARGLEKAMLRQLASCNWVTEHLNVLITGGTGVGKSFLACALGQGACRRALRVTYRHLIPIREIYRYLPAEADRVFAIHDRQLRAMRARDAGELALALDEHFRFLEEAVAQASGRPWAELFGSAASIAKTDAGA